jgi:N-acetylneuraminate synthase
MTIPVLKEVFADCLIGLSDHTMGVGAAIASVALGARVIEKHFTLSRAEGGVDSTFSLEPEELRSLVVESERAFLALGHPNFGILDEELKSKDFKRSIYVTADISEGQILSKDNIRVIRPGDGLEPKFYETLLGIEVKRPLKKGTPLKFRDLL